MDFLHGWDLFHRVYLGVVFLHVLALADQYLLHFVRDVILGAEVDETPGRLARIINIQN